MSNDLFLPAVSLTLVANAVLVAVALRALRRGRTNTASPDALPPARPRDLVGGSPPAHAATPVVTVVATPPAPAIAVATGPAQAATPGPDVEPEPDPPSEPEPGRRPASETATAEPAKRRRSPRAAATPTDRPEPRRRGRRRFSLPPLDDDHEKVNRSIESFLAGSEPAAEPGDGSQPSVRDSSDATTVALVAIDGLPGDDDRPSDEAAMTAVEQALAIVERTLRGAARGSDEVAVDAPGRYRIVLAATGELAARAYLRRVRATVEPLLEAAERPLRLVIATATVLDEPVERATEVAARRLAAGLASDRRAAERDAPDAEPMAAGD